MIFEYCDSAIFRDGLAIKRIRTDQCTPFRHLIRDYLLIRRKEVVVKWVNFFRKINFIFCLVSNIPPFYGHLPRPIFVLVTFPENLFLSCSQSRMKWPKKANTRNLFVAEVNLAIVYERTRRPFFLFTSRIRIQRRNISFARTGFSYKIKVNFVDQCY